MSSKQDYFHAINRLYVTAIDQLFAVDIIALKAKNWSEAVKIFVMNYKFQLF